MKFIVDNEWQCSDLYDTIEDQKGNINNLLVVDQVSLVDDKDSKKAKGKDKEDQTEFLSLGSDTDKVIDYLNEVVESSADAVVLRLKWKGNARNVFVKGEFSNWQPLTLTRNENDLWKIELKIKTGKYLMKFIVDGKDTLSEYLETYIENDETFNILEVISHAHEKIAEHSTEAVNVTDDEVTDVTIQWKGVADTVMVSGEFSNWSGISLANTGDDNWTVSLRLKLGEYLMMFFVDGEVVLTDDMKQVTDEAGDQYNLLEVTGRCYKKLDVVDDLDSDEQADRVALENLEISNDELDGNKMDEQNILQNNFAADDHETDVNSCEKQIAWFGFADDVRVIGDFSNWTPISLSHKEPEFWVVTLKLPEGPHLLKFIVDKKFTLSEQMEKVIGPDQEIYNLIHVGTNNSLKYEIR